MMHQLRTADLLMVLSPLRLETAGGWSSYGGTSLFPQRKGLAFPLHLKPSRVGYWGCKQVSFLICVCRLLVSLMRRLSENK